MDNVLQVTINPDIKLFGKDIDKMPDSIKQPLLITITMAMERYNCDWRELEWRIKYYNGQPVISVKKK